MRYVVSEFGLLAAAHFGTLAWSHTLVNARRARVVPYPNPVVRVLVQFAHGNASPPRLLLPVYRRSPAPPLVAPGLSCTWSTQRQPPPKHHAATLTNCLRPFLHGATPTSACLCVPTLPPNHLTRCVPHAARQPPSRPVYLTSQRTSQSLPSSRLPQPPSAKVTPFSL